MTYLPRLEMTPTVRWADFLAELDRWGEIGRIASLWWRDDDAVAPTPRLDTLLRLARDVPLALAVIPEPAEPSLMAALVASPNVAVLQHGWRHANRGGTGKKSEFPANRPAAEVAADLTAGAQRLARLFGPRFVPILAPPWNRFAAEFTPLLAPAGIAGLSTMTAGQPNEASRIVRTDVHIDLVAWKIGARVYRGGDGAGSARRPVAGTTDRRR